MLKFLLVILTYLLIFNNIGYADIRLYLVSNVKAVDANLLLCDIARIDSDNSSIEKIRNLKIDESFYFDGYIDRRELAMLLNENTDDIFLIYGTAVRVFQKENYQISHVDFVSTEKCLLQKGERVNIIIRKKGLSLELNGTVMDDCKINDEITVRIKNKYGNSAKFVKGRVKSKNVIEVVL